MEKERKITAPEGCEIEKVELIDGVAVVTFRDKERKLPKTWDEFCEMFPEKKGEFLISDDSDIYEYTESEERFPDYDKNLLPDRATAEAVLALCQLIQLRNCYNGDWVPNWDADKVETSNAMINVNAKHAISCGMLYFKTKELRDEFMRYFSTLIDKLRPLYGDTEGGEE